MAVAVVIAIAMMAAFARFFQIMAALLRLTASRTMPAFGLMKSLFSLFDALAAFSVVPIVVAIKRPRGNGAGEEHCNHTRCNECLQSLSHAALLRRLLSELRKIAKESKSKIDDAAVFTKKSVGNAGDSGNSWLIEVHWPG